MYAHRYVRYRVSSARIRRCRWLPVATRGTHMAICATLLFTVACMSAGSGVPEGRRGAASWAMALCRAAESKWPRRSSSRRSGCLPHDQSGRAEESFMTWTTSRTSSAWHRTFGRSPSPAHSWRLGRRIPSSSASSTRASPTRARSRRRSLRTRSGWLTRTGPRASNTHAFALHHSGLLAYNIPFPHFLLPIPHSPEGYLPHGHLALRVLPSILFRPPRYCCQSAHAVGAVPACSSQWALAGLTECVAPVAATQDISAVRPLCVVSSARGR